MEATLQTDPSLSLQRAMQRLWVDHVVWTRQYVISAIAGTPDADAAAGRLLRNQEDIGNALVPFYGEDAGAAVTDLLKQHILIAVDIVDAAVKGDKERFEAADHKWDENSADIAAALALANPFWPEKDVQDLLSLHLNLTRKEVVSRLDGRWEEDVQSFDDILTEILTLSDVLSSGLVQQFPDRFAPAATGQSSSNGGSSTGGSTTGRDKQGAPSFIRWR